MRPVLTEEEIQRRMPVWLAMADLFLDTPYLEIFGAEAFAEPLRKSGYDRDTLGRIFFDEVLPAFAYNLLSVAGQWGAWPPNFVRERVTDTLSFGEAISRRIEAARVRKMVEGDWRQVEALL